MTNRRATRFPDKIVSGGQTGVDRAALDTAIALGVDHGGWCPQGRLAEDGVIPGHYNLRETDRPAYPLRTRLNVTDSDGTLILYRDQIQGGTELTAQLAQQLGKPLLALDLATVPDPQQVRRWLIEQQIRTLNVAGPRASSAPGIDRQAADFLHRVLVAP
jgi:predicted Rossmann fold nucleotide-binding protein DprA/Smf involved in DNA uptake